MEPAYVADINDYKEARERTDEAKALQLEAMARRLGGKERARAYLRKRGNPVRE